MFRRGPGYTATLPTNGATIYVRPVYGDSNGKATLYNDYSYTEFPHYLATITSRPRDSDRRFHTFNGTTGAAAYRYYLWIGHYARRA